MQDHFTRLRDRRGGTMALIAVTLTGLLAAMSLAVDMGQFFTARAEAQRVADAAALAGASSFMSFWPDSATAHDTAVARAMDIATTNNVRGDFVDPNDVAVQVLYSEEKVRVHVRKLGLGTWFGRFAERFNIDVSTSAAARAIPSEGPTCVKPWAIPDLWYEVDGTSSGNGGNWRPNTDSIADGMWQEEEGVWQLGDHADEYYSPYGDNHVDGDTGYGSNYRFDNYGWPDQHDWGVQLIVQAADDHRHAGEVVPCSRRVGDGRAVRPSGLPAGAVHVLAPALLRGGEVGDHRVDGPGAHPDPQARRGQALPPGPAPGGDLELRHVEDPHPPAVGLEQAPDGRHAEGGVVDVAVARDEEHVEGVPAALGHLGARAGEEGGGSGHGGSGLYPNEPPGRFRTRGRCVRPVPLPLPACLCREPRGSGRREAGAGEGEGRRLRRRGSGRGRGRGRGTGVPLAACGG